VLARKSASLLVLEFVPLHEDFYGVDLPSAMSPRKGTRPTPKSSTILNNIFALTSFGRPPSTCWQVLKTIIAMNASITSPMLGSKQSAHCRIKSNELYLPRNDTDDRAPAKPDTAAIEQTHVKSICSPFDFGQNLGIMFGNACWHRLAPLLPLLARWPAI